MKILCDSERGQLLKALREADTEGVGVDDRYVDSDTHLLFEALHVLSDNIPERIFALLHPCGSIDHPEANPGKTMLMLQSVASSGARANC